MVEMEEGSKQKGLKANQNIVILYHLLNRVMRCLGSEISLWCKIYDIAA